MEVLWALYGVFFCRYLSFISTFLSRIPSVLRKSSPVGLIYLSVICACAHGNPKNALTVSYEVCTYHISTGKGLSHYRIRFSIYKVPMCVCACASDYYIIAVSHYSGSLISLYRGVSIAIWSQTTGLRYLAPRMVNFCCGYDISVVVMDVYYTAYNSYASCWT